MTVAEVIRQVRLCLDEEKANFANLAEIADDDNVYMDNIIRAKINDALLWVCQYASADLLSSSSASSTDGIVSTKTYTSKEWTEDQQNNIAKITLSSTPLRVTRVMGDDWHRGFLTPYTEDSDEFAMMYNDTEKGTVDLPRVGILQSFPPVLYVQPIPSSVTVMVVNAPSEQDVSSDTKDISVPVKVKTSFIYYIAYLVMIAYENVTKANACYQVAVQNLGLKTNDNG